MTHPIYQLEACPVAGCNKRHGVSPLRSGSDSDLTATLGSGAREGASGSERSGFDDRFTGSRMDHPPRQASGATRRPEHGSVQAGTDR